MSATSMEVKASVGLANSLSNVFKLADVTGLCWVRYTGPTSSTLEAPQDDPVLKTYAQLLSEGYACAWRRLSPSTDGQTGEAKDLWLFYFTDQPDLSTKLTAGLEEAERGNWKEEMTKESTTMLYRALHNLIERSLLSENFLPLGKWFARPDSSVATDGSSRGCFLCSFSFFVHAHLYVCASVDMRAGPALQPLLPSHVSQALASSTGLQVILSPSGLNAVMTGHSYSLSDSGIDKILEEWKLFFPRRFSADSSLGLPAAIEVVIGGVRMRYPSQFVLVYHGEDSLPTPPPSPLNQGEVEDTVHEVWEATRGGDTELKYKEATQCHCQDSSAHKSSRRHSSQLEPLPLKAPPTHPSHRFEPYSRRPRALPAMTPITTNTPQLSVKRKLSKPSLPMYSTTPVVSPSLPPSSSPPPLLLHLHLLTLSQRNSCTSPSSSHHTAVAIFNRATGVPSYLEALQPILCGPDLRSRGHAPFLCPQLPSPLTDVDQLPSSASQHTLSLTAAAALSQISPPDTRRVGSTPWPHPLITSLPVATTTKHTPHQPTPPSSRCQDYHHQNQRYPR
ncbi:Mediator of RNA polymerase II transcription subunit 13-like [Geodia barretti]|uniref:Mediator of RNA polymerase II transcription subunit 13 n=2 Tax=Geodia barretti TaxID=519541 RepID=A0AA35S405_GEOBA|nr:Mediator of RNA polymerase II transcription subunit 13-like [Geodia barretti]